MASPAVGGARPRILLGAMPTPDKRPTVDDRRLPPDQVERPKWLRATSIALAYVLTFGAIIFAIPRLISPSRSWMIGLSLFAVVVPVFPAVQIVLTGERPARIPVFAKIYVAEFASLLVQFLFLLASAPIIAVLVAGRLAVALLVAAGLACVIVSLQLLGLDIFRKVPREETPSFFLVFAGLAVTVGIYYGITRLTKKHEDSYYRIWANLFVKIRRFFRY